MSVAPVWVKNKILFVSFNIYKAAQHSLSFNTTLLWVLFCFCSIKSSFQLRTFDPEGVVFYGDTKNGEDWFILSLKDGLPLMQISRGDILVSVEGGPKINDGKWHIVSLQCRLIFSANQCLEMTLEKMLFSTGDK